MAKPARETGPVAQNRRARYDYFIEDEVEAGLVLTGSEVKSLRQGKCSLNEAYAGERDGDIWLWNVHIAEYPPANKFNHPPKRPRKLLLHQREINRLLSSVNQAGYTLIPLSIYFNGRGIAKLKLGLAKGKRTIDKRETTKKREWQREKSRLMRNLG